MIYRIEIPSQAEDDDLLRRVKVKIEVDKMLINLNLTVLNPLNKTLTLRLLTNKSKIMGIKPGPKKIAESTGKPDRRQRDNKETPKNVPSLKPHKHKKGD